MLIEAALQLSRLGTFSGHHINKDKLGGVQFFIGVIWPLMLSLVLYFVDDLTGLHLFIINEGGLGFVQYLPIVQNILKHSGYAHVFIPLFSFTLLLFPLGVVYWWRVLPTVFEQRVREMRFKQASIIFLSGLLMCAVFFLVWIIDAEGLSQRKQAQFVNTFQYPVLFYLFVLLPVSLGALFCTVSMKLVYVKIKKSTKFPQEI